MLKLWWKSENRNDLTHRVKQTIQQAFETLCTHHEKIDITLSVKLLDEKLIHNKPKFDVSSSSSEVDTLETHCQESHKEKIAQSHQYLPIALDGRGPPCNATELTALFSDTPSLDTLITFLQRHLELAHKDREEFQRRLEMVNHGEKTRQSLGDKTLPAGFLAYQVQHLKAGESSVYLGHYGKPKGFIELITLIVNKLPEALQQKIPPSILNYLKEGNTSQLNQLFEKLLGAYFRGGKKTLEEILRFDRHLKTELAIY